MTRLGISSLALALLGTLPIGVAHAGPGAMHAAPAPSPTAAPAPPPTAAPAPPPTAAPAAAAKILIPANLFTLPASQVLTVNGKQMTAGAVRDDIRQQILKQAGPPKMVRVASGKRGGPSHAATIVPKPHGVYAAPNRDCTGRAPAIQTISGPLTPGQQITLSGTCFGPDTGQVKLIGPFPGGVLQLTFAHWSAGNIVAAVPAVRGVTDQGVALAVVTAAKVESASTPIAFVAAREKVEVPARAWTPTHYEMTREITSTPPTREETSPTQFNVTVNAECYLDSMEATAKMGVIQSVTGWSDGPPNASTVQIAWAPQVSITTYHYVVGGDTDKFAGMSIDVKAWADCPVGIAP